MSPFTLLATLAAALAGATLLWLVTRPSNRGQVTLKLRARPMFTPILHQFLRQLEEAVPEIRFCPQVSMAALVEPQAPRSLGDLAQALGTFGHKRVAVVATARSDGAVIALIEIERAEAPGGDRTHNRDALTAQAGYLTIRWNPKRLPVKAEIRRILLEAAGRTAQSESPPAADHWSAEGDSAPPALAALS